MAEIDAYRRLDASKQDHLAPPSSSNSHTLSRSRSRSRSPSPAQATTAAPSSSTTMNTTGSTYSGSDSEGSSGYRRGGYHRVHIGDVYERYTVELKLGWGHFSTVWLASTTDQQLVALKIQKSATQYSEAARDEIELLRTAQVHDRDRVQPIVALLDDTIISGPNGRHHCLVFEAMGTNLLTMIKRYNYQGIPLDICKVIVRQIIRGLDFLHSKCRIIHTDLKPENFLLSSPQWDIQQIQNHRREIVRQREIAHSMSKELNGVALDSDGARRLKRNQKKRAKQKLRKQAERDKANVTTSALPTLPVSSANEYSISGQSNSSTATTVIDSPLNSPNTDGPAMSPSKQSESPSEAFVPISLADAASKHIDQMLDDFSKLSVNDPLFDSPTASFPFKVKVADLGNACCPENDTRVLTDSGFLFLADIEARIANGQRVLYACYETRTQSIVYEAGELVIVEPPSRWVDYTHADTRRHWNGSSNDYGATTTNDVDDNGLTLRITPQHEMYVQPCTDDDQGATVAPMKIPARELSPGFQCECDRVCVHCFSHFRTFTAAINGLSTPHDVMTTTDRDPHSPVVALCLRDSDELNAFCEFVGYFIRDGARSSNNGITFEARDKCDRMYVADLLARLHLIRGQHFVCDEDEVTMRICIVNPRWICFFNDQYEWARSVGQRYRQCALVHSSQRRSSYASFVSTDSVSLAANTETNSLSDSDSDSGSATASVDELDDALTSDDEMQQCVDDNDAPSTSIPHWMMFRLAQDQIKLIIKGLSQVDATRSAPDGVHSKHGARRINVRGVALRDAILHLCLCAGYSAYFKLRTDDEEKFMPMCTRHDVWWVYFSESSSELMPARDVRFDGGVYRHKKQSATAIATTPGDLYDKQRDGRVWCVQVQHNDHLIFVQRAHRNGDGVVTKVGRSMIVGNCWVHKHFTDDVTTRQYRAPEVLVGYPYSTPIDMWSIACIVFELVTGDYLFDPKDDTNGKYSRDDDHLALMIELLGTIPKKLSSHGKFSRSFFNKKGALRNITELDHWGLAAVLAEKYKFAVEEAESLASFLLPMLQLDPDRRCTAAQALMHHWLRTQATHNTNTQSRTQAETNDADAAVSDEDGDEEDEYEDEDQDEDEDASIKTNGQSVSVDADLNVVESVNESDASVDDDEEDRAQANLHSSSYESGGDNSIDSPNTPPLTTANTKKSGKTLSESIADLLGFSGLSSRSDYKTYKETSNPADTRIDEELNEDDTPIDFDFDLDGEDDVDADDEEDDVHSDGTESPANQLTAKLQQTHINNNNNNNNNNQNIDALQT